MKFFPLICQKITMYVHGNPNERRKKYFFALTDFVVISLRTSLFTFLRSLFPSLSNYYRQRLVNILWKGRKIAISTEMNEGSVGRALPEEVLRPYTKIGPAQPNMRRTKALGNGHTFPGKWWKAQQQDCLSILFPWERGFSLADFIWQATDGRLMDPTRSCE